MKRSRAAATALLTTSLLVGVALTPSPAQAAPTYPSGAHLTAVSHTAIKVGVDKISDPHGNPTSYRLVASTTKAHVVTSYLNAHGFRSDYSGSSKTNSILITGMKYTSSPYYYRVGTVFARYPNYVAWGTTYSSGFGLAPNAPTGVTTVHGSAGTYLQWTAPSGGSTGAAIDQTNTSTGAKHTYTIHNTTAKFTPYGLGRAKYSFRVRAINVATHSGSSASSASITGPFAETTLRVMSYNVLGAYLPQRQKENDGNTVSVSGWSSRVRTAAALVKKYLPDVLNVQEGDTILGASGSDHPQGNHAYPSAEWPGNWATPSGASCNQFYNASIANSPYKGSAHYWPYRQADSLCDYTNSALGSSTYVHAVDGTWQHNGSTNYLIYNKDKLTQFTASALGVSSGACSGSDDPNDTSLAAAPSSQIKCGGYWSIDDSTGFESAADTRNKPTERTAAWAAFQLKNSAKTKVLIVSPHTSAELSTAFDGRRTAQVTNMVRLAQAKAKQLGIKKIIYGGDFNNYVGRPGLPDSTTPVMKAAGYTDSIENAQHSYNTSYLSGNFYKSPPQRTPGNVPGYSCLDHIYVYPGIAVQSFGEALILNSNGTFPGAIPSDHNPVWADLILQN